MTPREKFDTGMYISSVGAAFYFTGDNTILVDSGYSNQEATIDMDGWIYTQGRKVGKLTK
jgi:hypothetical protein